MKTLLLLLSLAFSAVAGADWPRYRGANFDGISSETGLNLTWPATGPKEAWRATLGPAGSSVVVSQGRLYTMGNVENNDIVYCLDAATGKEIWRYSYPCPLDKRSFEGGPAGTPTVDGNLVFTTSHKNLVYCLDAQTGKVVWSKDLLKEFKAKRPMWGFAGSALIEGDLAIFDVGADGASTVALNKQTGALVWKAGDEAASYASPMPWTWNGKRAVLTFKARALVAQDMATGAELWRHPWKTSWDVHCAYPIPVGADKVFFSSGYDTGAALLDVKTKTPAVIWQNKNMCNEMASSVLLDGYVYGVSGNDGAKATVNCVEVATGNLMWSYKGLGCGTLLAAGGKLIVLGEKGELVVAEASPKEFKPLAKAQVLEGRCWVVPVLVNGILYCRSNQGTLVALDLRPGAVAAAPTKAEPFAADFEKDAVDKLPASIVSEAAFAVKEDAGNKFLELPGTSAAETVSAQFGSATAQMQVSARAWSAKKGRMYPQFGLGAGGTAGWRVQVSPGKKAVELLLGDEIKATASFEWTTEKWTQLSLSVHAGKIEASAQVEGQTEPTKLTAEAAGALPTGKAVLWAGPFAGTAIRFDDLKLTPQ